MKDMIGYIRQKNVEFSDSALFKHLSDDSISPYQRLALAPYLAHFVFSFMDINRFVLRDLESDEELQHLVNVHSHEDAHHWPWYLNDLKRLGLDKRMFLTEALYFVWGDHCIKSRLLTYRMAALIGQATNKEKIMIVEVIEMTGNVFLGHTANVCKEIEDSDHLQYFGVHHYRVETGHHMGSADIEDLLAQINVDEAEASKGRLLIDRVYSLYQEFVDEMFDYARAHTMEELQRSPLYEAAIVREVPQKSRAPLRR